MITSEMVQELWESPKKQPAIVQLSNMTFAVISTVNYFSLSHIIIRRDELADLDPQGTINFDDIQPEDFEAIAQYLNSINEDYYLYE